MTEQKFVGDKPVDEFPSSVLQKADDDKLTRKEVGRDPAKQPGANKREGITSRDPASRQLTWVLFLFQLKASGRCRSP